MIKEYTYYAFISYKREDEKWAKWLHKKLESYGFPTALRKKNSELPAKIRPVFRDKPELAGGNLKEEIEKGLENSKYLIVICSPRSAQSPWVSKEVQFFIDKGRSKYIIPFIIGGTPNSTNPKDECFPEGLRQLSGEKEILGININEMGRSAAAIKVISQMFGLRFDTLWQRHERKKRHKRLVATIILISIVIASLIFSNYIANLNKKISAERDHATAQTQLANEERDKAIIANATSLISEDSYGAAIIALELLSRHNNVFPEAEALLREASKVNNISLIGHSLLVNDISFNDSIHIASASADNTVKIWDLNNGNCIKTFKYNSSVQGVSYVPNSTKLISATEEGRVYIYDTKAKRFTQEFVAFDESYVSSFELSPNGKYLAISNDKGQLKVFLTSDFQLILDKPAEDVYDVLAITFSQDEDVLAWVSGDCICVTDMTTHKTLKKELVYDYKETSPIDISFNFDNSEIALGLSNCIKIYNANNLNEKKTIQTELLTSINYYNDNMLITTHENGKIKLWGSHILFTDLPTKDQFLTKTIVHPTLRYFAYISNRTDGIIKILDLQHIDGITYEQHIENKYDSYIYSIDITYKNGRPYYAITDEHSLKFFQLSDDYHLTPIATDDITRFNRSKIIFSPSGKYLVGHDNNTIYIWESASGKLLNSFEAHNDYIRYFYFPNRYDMLLTIGHNDIKIWNISNLKANVPVREYNHFYDNPITAYSDQIQITSDLNYLYYIDISENDVNVMDLKHNKTISLPFNISARYISKIKLSPDNRQLAVVDSDLRIWIFDVNSMKCINSWIAHTTFFNSINWHPSNRYIVSSADDNSIKIWHVASGHCVSQINTSCTNDVKFTIDGNYIIGHSGYSIGVFYFPPLYSLIDMTQKRFRDRVLTDKEKRIYHIK